MREDLSKYVESMRAEGKRDEAVAHLKDMYATTRDRAVWELLERVCTGPELAGVPRPPDTTVGPERDPILPTAPFTRLLPGALLYPFTSGAALYMLVVAGPLMFGTSYLMRAIGCFGLAIMSLPYGFLMAYLYDVVIETAEGRARAPRVTTVLWAEGSRIGYFSYFGRWLVATIVSGVPLTIFLSAYLSEEATAASRPYFLGLTLAAAVAGLVWYPVALLQSVFGEWYSPFNIPRGRALMGRLGADYAICAAVFVVTTAAYAGFQFAAMHVAGNLYERRMVAMALASWVTYAMMLIQMRALGLLRWSRHEDVTVSGRGS